LLAERGYDLQALGQAASIFEGWVTLTAIRNEDDAERWLLHSDESTSFGRIRPLTQQALQHILGEVQEADKPYGIYRQLCMAKHLNPILERTRGHEIQEGTIAFLPGPDTRPLAINHSWFALERGARLASFAIIAFIHNDPALLSSDLKAKIEEQQVRLNALQTLSVQRWPESYPPEA